MKKILLIKNFTIFFIFLVLSNKTLLSQTRIVKANNAFGNKDYYTAICLYKKILQHKKSDKKIRNLSFRIAESYRFGNYPLEAKEWYEKAISFGCKDSSINYNYANMLFIIGKYEEAKTYFEKHLKLFPSDKNTIAKLNSVDFALRFRKDSLKNTDVFNITEINSPYSDFSPCKIGDKIIFASARQEKETGKLYTYTGQYFSDFYETIYNKKEKKWQTPVKSVGGINSAYNDGTIYYDEIKRIAIFMQCNGIDGSGNYCGLYSSKYDKKKSMWSEAKTYKIGNTTYNYGHPTFTSDGKILFFVSDMPGGKGGKDIWVFKKNAINKSNIPENIGDIINTSGDEMFPYVLNDSILFFASNGREGYGGLDLYYSIFKGNNFSEPVNLGQPFNSYYDDFGIIYFGKDSGMFCSNRNGSIGNDDIYKFITTHFKINVFGEIFDSETKTHIENAIVILKTVSGYVDSTFIDTSGKYHFNSLKLEDNYEIIVKKAGYITEGKTLITPIKLRKTENIELNFLLTKIKEEEIEIPEIFYDFDKWNIREESKISIDKILKMLRENPDMNIRINSHTDERGLENYNLELSAKRAQSVVNYLIEKGIDENRLTSKGWGKTNPRVINAKTEEEHQSNRRTTFNIVNSNDLNSDYIKAHFQKIEDKVRQKKPKVEIEKDPIKIILSNREDDDVDFRINFANFKLLVENENFRTIAENIPEFTLEYMVDKDGIYHYSIGSLNDYDEAKDLLERVKRIGYKSAKIVAYKGNAEISVNEAEDLLKLK